MIARLFDYFGLVGVGSILFWIAAAGVGVAYGVKSRHRYLPRIALALAIVAMLLANRNSATVSNMQVDRSEEVKAQEEKVKAQTIAAMKRRAADIRFAEDNATDALDLGGGANAADAKKLADTAAATQPGGSLYDYRKQGKQQREVGKARAREFADPSDPASTQPAASQPATPTFVERLWPEAQVLEANLYDVWNLFFARWTLRLLILLALFDYLLRYARTFDTLLPWPLVHLLSDRIFRKAPAVFVRNAPPGLARAFLERALQKGETFIYLGQSDPWPNAPALPKSLLPSALGAFDKLLFDPAGPIPDPAFVFNAAWFNRGCVVAPTPQAVQRLLDYTLDRLEHHPRTHAPADATVNLVYEAGPLPAPDLLQRLAAVAGARNFRLVVLSPEPLPPTLKSAFAEIYDGPAAVPFSQPRFAQYAPRVDAALAAGLRLLARALGKLMIGVDRLMDAIARPIERRERALEEAARAAAQKTA